MMKSLKRYKIKSLKYGLLSTALLVTMIMSAPQSASAAVSGQCANCHTMHYSQGATQLGTWGGSGPYSSLLTNDCLGCHTTTGADPLVNNYPFVSGSGFNDDNCLAGGYFTGGGGNNDDNSHTMGSNNLPAGYSGTWYTGVANGFSCAGTNGCHGNHTNLDDMDAISGEHHTGSGAYRMLYVDTAGSNPVAGVPADDYEEALVKNTTYPGSGAIAHNVYSADASSDNTISEFCALCHPNFHGTAGTEIAGSWIRHPTDVVIPSSWDIGSEANTLTDSDNKRNPVGWAGADEGTGERRATCISCHRAHGTANNDLLRWEYSTQVAGGGNNYGCLGCHDKQM
ncbi:MAG: hypothetical protein KAR13_15995 [Desulfobulbaceae bacterium]|nr:hypothetical protein [Desulfobulbaceae bacterium]